MKYFIYKSNNVREVSQKYYENWAFLEIEKYQLPDYLAVINNHIYRIESIYQGKIDNEDCNPPKPFVLFLIKDLIELQIDGLKYVHSEESIEFFETFFEIKLRRNELIEEIKKLI